MRFVTASEEKKASVHADHDDYGEAVLEKGHLDGNLGVSSSAWGNFPRGVCMASPAPDGSSDDEGV